VVDIGVAGQRDAVGSGGGHRSGGREVWPGTVRAGAKGQCRRKYDSNPARAGNAMPLPNSFRNRMDHLELPFSTGLGTKTDAESGKLPCGRLVRPAGEQQGQSGPARKLPPTL